MAKVTLPDGCKGLDMADGTKYNADGRGRVDMSPEHAKYLKTSWYGQSGVMTDSQSLSFGTKRSMLCTPCKRAWNAWSTTCPRCGEPTTEG
jgi:hypothetical protein